MDAYYAGVYWGDRKESAARCADRLSTNLVALANVDPLLASWRAKGQSKATAKLPIGTDARSLEILLATGRNRADVDGSVIEQLGFSFDLWNGQTPAIGLSGTVGQHSGVAALMNTWVLDLPAPVGEAARLYEPLVARAVFAALVDAWEPDWGTWTSHTLRQAQQPSARTPFVGWVTYLARARLSEKDARAIGAEQFGRGWLVQGADDVLRFDEDAARVLRHDLQSVGALTPTP